MSIYKFNNVYKPQRVVTDVVEYTKCWLYYGLTTKWLAAGGVLSLVFLQVLVSSVPPQ
jgi:hypothetical protein